MQIVQLTENLQRELKAEKKIDQKPNWNNGQ